MPGELCDGFIYFVEIDSGNDSDSHLQLDFGRGERAFSGGGPVAIQ